MDSLRGLIGSLYNDYILRDLLGYAVPGLVLFLSVCGSVWMIDGDSFKDALRLANLPGIDSFSRIVLIAVFSLVCYSLGHAVAGLTFNTPVVDRAWNYFDRKIFDDELYQEHLLLWREAEGNAKKLSESIGNQRERLAVLKHLTGMGSASLAVSVPLLVVASWIAPSSNLSSKGTYPSALIFAFIVSAVILVGLYRHYCRLCVREFHYEIAAIARYVSSEPSDSWFAAIQKIEKHTKANPPAKRTLAEKFFALIEKIRKYITGSPSVKSTRFPDIKETIMNRLNLAKLAPEDQSPGPAPTP